MLDFVSLMVRVCTSVCDARGSKSAGLNSCVMMGAASDVIIHRYLRRMQWILIDVTDLIESGEDEL